MIPWVKSCRPSTSTSSSSFCIISSPRILCPDLSSVPGRVGTWVHTQQMCSSVKDLKYRANKVFLFWKSPLPFKDCKATFPSNRNVQLNHRHKCCFSRTLRDLSAECHRGSKRTPQVKCSEMCQCARVKVSRSVRDGTAALQSRAS